MDTGPFKEFMESQNPKAKPRPKSPPPINGKEEQDPFGPNRDGYDSDNHYPSGETAPELTDEELKEFNKTELERYRLRQKNFPAPMNEAAFHGVAGDVVRIIKAVSEACQEAILS